MTGDDSPMIERLMRIDLIKYQALGNDYLVMDLPGPLEEVVAQLPVLCDRQLGLGSDGLLAFDPRAMTVRIFNPDGSEAQKSGNGLRITAAHDHDLTGVLVDAPRPMTPYIQIQTAFAAR